MSRSEVLLMVGGSIAAYKACHLVSRLTQAGHGVQVVATPSALQFVGSATWEGLSGRPVVSETFEPGRAMDHIHLVRRADVIIAAPASADSSTSEYLIRALTADPQDLDEESVRTAVEFVARCNSNRQDPRNTATTATLDAVAPSPRQENLADRSD